MWGLGQHTLLGIVVGLCEASNTLYYFVVGLCASGNTLLGNTLAGYCCWFMWGLGQHTLLGIVVGYVRPRATHCTGYCCWFMRGLGQHTLLGIVVGYARFWAKSIGRLAYANVCIWYRCKPLCAATCKEATITKYLYSNMPINY
jgi:uncharacterized membrane protein